MLAAYVFPIMLALVALIIEFNQIRAISNDLKAAVDAAALAGVLAADVYADTYEERIYDNEGRLIRVDPVTYNHRIVNYHGTAFQYAYRTFKRNMDNMGWTSDGRGRVTIYTADLHGEPFASGMIDAVTGEGVPDNRGEYSDVDEYQFSARARVKTYLIGPILEAMSRIMGIEPPVDDMGRIIIEQSSKARVKVEITG
ncbi:hypothetical protein GCM10010965_15010 [Caldalkalibacillus thermarum]|uniref:hypothetical protein n=1 Tax=Caldalkalibacillus thermarum TaxID=296745 RepID=UPI001669C4C4|nr:hypothetical protein [Caldalkalibacillus thermarum]GGK23182.1 hypothetical protein GCM10010965_15010 [Caldalkalibacillus thermarum]